LDAELSRDLITWSRPSIAVSEQIVLIFHGLLVFREPGTFGPTARCKIEANPS
jgi:hypothetical protein